MNERSSTTLAYGGDGPPAGADPKSKSLSCAPVTAGCAWPPWLCYASARQPRRLRARTVDVHECARAGPVDYANQPIDSAVHSRRGDAAQSVQRSAPGGLGASGSVYR